MVIAGSSPDTAFHARALELHMEHSGLAIDYPDFLTFGIRYFKNYTGHTSTQFMQASHASLMDTTG